MTTKNVEAIITPPAPHFVGDGFRVHNYIPSNYLLSMQRMSPFIMLDYNAPHYFEPTETPRGVGIHPHRGFETVTIAYKGKIAHHDSAGNSGVISEGDVQWMTAASGVLHKEYHEENFSKEGGYFQMVQLWINLPAAQKMTTPKYQELKNDKMGKHKIDEQGSYVEVIAGNYKNIKGAANTFTPLHIFNIILKKGIAETVSLPQNFNTGLVIIEGNVKINNTENGEANEFVLLKNDGENFIIEAVNDAIVLVISGEPINEPIAAHGPFVMNTQQEIVEAFNDYHNGKFGVLNYINNKQRTFKFNFANAL